jgi:hypothetical protein
VIPSVYKEPDTCILAAEDGRWGQRIEWVPDFRNNLPPSSEQKIEAAGSLKRQNCYQLLIFVYSQSK